MPDPLIVKVQRPLNIHPVPHLALIYPEGKTWMIQRKLTPAEDALLGDRAKAFCEAKFIGGSGTVTLLRVVADEPW